MHTDYHLWMKWNDRLKKARDDAGAKDTDLCRACDVKASSVNGWMSGETKNIEARYLLPACRLLRVSPYWVMFGKDDQDFLSSQAIAIGKAFDQLSPEQREGLIAVIKSYGVTPSTISATTMRLTERQNQSPRQHGPPNVAPSHAKKRVSGSAS